MTSTLGDRRRAVVAIAIMILALAGVPSPAAAHVGASPSDVPAGASSVVDFSFSHGCAGSPTTSVAILIPEGVTSVRPVIDANWDIDLVMVDLDEPVTDSHGGTITERVEQVVFTARQPVGDAFRATLSVSMRTPDTPDTTLAFPTVQTCTEGEHAWIEVAAEGQDPHDLDSPAPAVRLVAADAGHGHGEEGDDEGDAHAPEAAVTSGTDPVTVVAVILGGLGVLLGTAALVRRRPS